MKIAGYQGGASVYHPNTLSDPDDPKSYTFVIPEGVTVMGGYNEGSYANGEYVEGSGNWDQENRNAAEYMTVLSAVSDAAGGRQEVNGYHAVQFGTGDGTVALNESQRPRGAVPSCRRGRMCATAWCATTRLSRAADYMCCPAVWCPVVE